MRLELEATLWHAGWRIIAPYLHLKFWNVSKNKTQESISYDS